MKEPRPRLTRKFLTSYFNSHHDDAYSLVAYLINKKIPDPVTHLRALYWLDRWGHQIDTGEVIGEIMIDGEWTLIDELPATLKKLHASNKGEGDEAGKYQ